MHKNDYYKPSEDTFLLAECLQNLSGENAMEIGTGSGYITNLLKESFKKVVATDIDLGAIKEARKKAKNVLFICCDSSSAITNVAFDLVVVNPPYLPSDTIGDVTVDGGKYGIEVTLQMVKDAKRLLKHEGRILIVTSSLANYDLLVNKLREVGNHSLC